MSARIEIGVAVFFLAVGVAGPPLDPLRIAGALAIAAVVAFSARFIAATAFVGVLAAGWLQHGQFRIALLAAAALLGIVVRFWGSTPRAASIIAATSAVLGLGWLFLA